MLFRDGGWAGDLRQGEIADGWFLGAAASVATKPDMLRSLFVQWDREQGVFTVRVFKEGKWREVTVDDRLPARKKTRTVRLPLPLCVCVLRRCLRVCTVRKGVCCESVGGWEVEGGLHMKGCQQAIRQAGSCTLSASPSFPASIRPFLPFLASLCVHACVSSGARLCKSV